MPQSISSRAATHAAVFAPLVGAGRADLVEQRLTDAITLGVLHDGERLPSESMLARQFGVAVVTAREALDSLRKRGLVTTRRGRDGGSFVTASGVRDAAILDERMRGVSRAELRDLGVHYAAIAGMAAEIAADRASTEEVESHRALVGSIDSATEGGARRGTGRFHLEVAALSQSARLVREEIRLQAEFGPLLWLCLREQDYRDGNRSTHDAVVDAISRVDGDGARRLTTDRIGAAVDWLIRAKAELETKENAS
ncbi:MAG: GntR family transcriptional regulator [Leifsonia sp.]